MFVFVAANTPTTPSSSSSMRWVRKTVTSAALWASPNRPLHKIQDYAEWEEVGYKHLLPKKLQHRFFMVHNCILESIYTHHQFTIP